MNAINKIRAFNARPARNAEFMEFSTHVCQIISQTAADTLGIGALRTAYIALFTELDKAFKINQAYLLTTVVQEQDAKRDTALKFVLQTIAANLSNPDAAKRQAAEKLNFVVKPYKGAASSTLYAETSEIEGLLQDANAPNNTSAVTTLGLAPGLTALKLANEVFRETYDTRVEDKTGRDSIESMKELRPQVDTAYRAMASAVNSLNEVNELVAKDPAKRSLLAPIINGVNGQIDWLENTINIRLTKAENKKEKEEARSKVYEK